MGPPIRKEGRAAHQRPDTPSPTDRLPNGQGDGSTDGRTFTDVTPPSVTDRAREHRTVPDARRLNSNRIVEQTVLTIEGATLGFKFIDYNALGHDHIDEWVAQLDASLPAILQLHRRLRALARVPSDASVTASCPCGAPLDRFRDDARYCSNACRQRAYRERTAS
jgi:hypothetical protein